ncbi:MAG: LptF/LptG family permease [Deferribacteraceae bacterium]|jgi:lipopolysaccharide export system permease protein|nr:LptF/LptG family permease [Deferribacteraceae bacterium]
MKITKMVLWEVIPLFITANFFFMTLLLLQQIVELAELIFVRSMPMFLVLETIIFYMPSFLVLTIPISALLAIVLAFNRFSSDSELIAMHACGASNFTLIVPVVIFGLATALIGIYMNVSLLPKGSSLAVDNLNRMLENLSINDIRAKEMYTDIDGMIFYANQKIDEANFEEILIVDTEQNAIISAQKGTIIPNASRSMMMQFEGGKLTQVDRSDQYSSISFGKMSLNYPLNLEVASMPRNEKLMGLAELEQHFSESGIYKFEYNKRFSMPLCALIMSLLGLTMGRATQRSGKSLGIALAALAIVGENVLFIVGEALSAKYDPLLLAWLPAALFTVITALMLYRMTRLS